MFQAADPRDRSFDAQAEASVRNAAVATKVAQLLVTVEVILGYLTLGLLISILANKVARRS